MRSEDIDSVYVDSSKSDATLPSHSPPSWTASFARQAMDSRPLLIQRPAQDRAIGINLGRPLSSTTH